MPILKVPASLTARNINGYSDDGQASKDAFHKQGKSFLKKLAAVLSPSMGEFSIRSNLGGIAGSGEVTLHGEHLYVQLSESCVQPGVSLMYRSCTSQKDYCGHQNHFVNMQEFSEQRVQSCVLSTMLRLIESEQARKQAQQASRQAATA